MKTLLVTTFSVYLMCAHTRADDSLRGGLIGAAIGAIVGHNSSDINTEIAVPAFAAAGALLGSQSDRDWYSPSYEPWGYNEGRHYRYDRYHRYGHHAPGYRYYRPRYHHRHETRPRHRAARVKKKTQRVVAKSADPHPGVRITVITVPMRNGSSIDFRILEVSGRFVGPQGENYDEMPTTDSLAGKYIPKTLRMQTGSTAGSGQDRS